MSTGTVKFFNEAKGFGFIKDNETGKEVFVHATGLVDKIRENDALASVRGIKGPGDPAAARSRPAPPP